MGKVQKNETGFSIIEVLIVLAIAGLIMVVVFLAVPALQRNARNNALNTNANNIFTGVSNYLSNNNGKLPPAVDDSDIADGVLVIGDNSGNDETVTVDSSIASVDLDGTEPAPGDTVGTVVIMTGSDAVCNDTKSGLTGSSTGSPRSIALVYVAESAGDSIVKCID